MSLSVLLVSVSVSVCFCVCVSVRGLRRSSVLIPTFTSYASLRMKVLRARSWDVITLTGAIEGSIRIMAV